MPIRIIIDIFSGLPNPTVELEGPEEEELLSRFAPLKRGSPAPRFPMRQPIFGCPCFISGQHGPRGISGLARAFRVGGPSSAATRTAGLAELDWVEEYVLKSKTILKRTQLRPP